jgi:small-conductance mechanosensitive channel
MILAQIAETHSVWKPVESVDWVQGLVIIVIGIPLIKLLSSLLGRFTAKRLSPHHRFWVQKGVFYPGVILVCTSALLEFGFNLTALLGAAGVMSVAIGFAAQTSLSNIISGFFLFAEKPFQVGDMILVNGVRGTVMAIDLLSVKIRTLDNLFVRLPNESLIKGEITNITYYPIRRMDINIQVAYKEDVQRVMNILKEIADENPNALTEPEPLILFKDFGTSSIDLLLGLWFEKSKFLQLKNSIMLQIKERFDKEGIEIPFPHITLYTGSETKPFPTQHIVDKS